MITVDASVPDRDKGDVLVVDGRVAGDRYRPRAEDAEVIDAGGMIVMPGFVNAHIHTWQTGLRGIAGDWAATNYFRAMHAGLATFFKPEDIYIANLVGALNQINPARRRSSTGTITTRRLHTRTPRMDGFFRAASARCSCMGRPSPTEAWPEALPEFPMPRGEVERIARSALLRRRARHHGACDPRAGNVACTTSA